MPPEAINDIARIRKQIDQANGLMRQVSDAVKKQNAAVGNLGASAVPLEIALPLQCMLAQWEIALQLAIANEHKLEEMESGVGVGA